MQQCAHCQYFVPTGYLSCPQCSMPLTAGAAAPHSVYSGKVGGAHARTPRRSSSASAWRSSRSIAITLVVRGGNGGSAPIETDSLPAVASTGGATTRLPTARSPSRSPACRPSMTARSVHSTSGARSIRSHKVTSSSASSSRTRRRTLHRTTPAGVSRGGCERPTRDRAPRSKPRGNSSRHAATRRSTSSSSSVPPARGTGSPRGAAHLIRVYAVLPADKQPTQGPVGRVQPHARFGAPVGATLSICERVRSSRAESMRAGTIARPQWGNVHGPRPCHLAR